MHGDLASPQEIREAIDRHRPDAMMHFAARSLVGGSMNAPFAYLRGNVINGLNLLEACVAGGVERFILSWTANLFGAPTSTVVDGQAPIAPGSPYGESKWALDWLSQTKGLRFASLLYFNAAWASEIRGEHHTPETHLIPLVLQVAAGHRDHITIFGDDYDTPDGTCIRDYLGNGEGFIVRQVIEAARVVTGAAISEQVDQRRAEDPARLVASSDRICDELGWVPQFPELEQTTDSATLKVTSTVRPLNKNKLARAG